MMSIEMWRFFWTCNIFVGILVIAGLYCIIMTRNLMRTLIGVELLMKAVTLLIIASGYVTRNLALAQALVITLIVIEVIVIAVACGVVLSIFRHNDSLDAKNIRSMKG